MIYRVIVISDTHGSTRALRHIILNYKDSAYCFIHCGDGEREVLAIREEFPDIKLHAVCGNSDFEQLLPKVGQVSVGGKEIFFTHGHTHQVYYGHEVLLNATKNIGATIALYGHTHVGYTGYQEGIYIMNPGSPVEPRDGKASFGVLDIGDMGVVCNLVKFGGV